MKRLRYFVLCTFMVLTGFISCSELNNTGLVTDPGLLPDKEIEKEPITDNDEFVILFTNDFHSQIDPMDNNRGGVRRIKALIDSVRNAEPVVLLADAGDLVQGTYYFSLLNGEVEMMILEELGYDIRTLGNHEFDKKMVGLGEMLALSKVPVVATNYDFSKTALDKYIENSAMINAGRIKVGFIGMNVMLRNLVDPAACEGVEWQNAINVADQEAEKLRKEGADIVIALSHLGYKWDNDIYYYDRGIALNTRHIDMIIGGHTHTRLHYPDYVKNIDNKNVPIVQTGSRGEYLGYAKIKLDKNDKPSFTYRLIPVTNRLDNRIDKDFSDMIDVYSADLNERMNRKIGYCPDGLAYGSYNSLECPIWNITADGLIWMAKEYYDTDADVSIYNTGGIRSTFAKGNITLGDIYEVYPFDNVLSILTLKGSDLMTLFESVASAKGMPINSGVKMVIDRSGNLKSVTIDGEPVDYNRTYTVATIDYVVNTGRYGLDKALTRNDSPEYIRDYFGEYFQHIADENDGEIVAGYDGRISYN